MTQKRDGGEVPGRVREIQRAAAAAAAQRFQTTRGVIEARAMHHEKIGKANCGHNPALLLLAMERFRKVALVCHLHKCAQEMTQVDFKMITPCLVDIRDQLEGLLSHIRKKRFELSTTANMCGKLPSDVSHFLMEIVPLLKNLFNHKNQEVLEHASVCLARIAEAFASSRDKLDELCNNGLVEQAAAFVSLSNSSRLISLSTLSYTEIIRLLSICTTGCPLAAKTLLRHGIIGRVKDIFSSSIAGTTVSLTSTRTSDQVCEIVNLVDTFLPTLPAGTIVLPEHCSSFKKGSSIRRHASSKQGEPGSIDMEVPGEEKLLLDQPELLEQFGIDLLPSMTQLYGSSLSVQIRHKCLSVIAKIMYYSSAEMVESLEVLIFLLGLLSRKDPQVLTPALQITKILAEKLPGKFSKMFVSERVVHAIESLTKWLAAKHCATKETQIFINHGKTTSCFYVQLDKTSKHMMKDYKKRLTGKNVDFYFSYNNKVLNPNRTLSSYGIQNGSTIYINYRMRGGTPKSFSEYVNNHKHEFTSIEKLPDGNLSPKLTVDGCRFLWSLVDCFTYTWGKRKSWNGLYKWDINFKIVDGIVRIAKAATGGLQSDSMENDIKPLLEKLDDIFYSKDSRLIDSRPPYLNHLKAFLGRMKYPVLSDVDKLVLTSHVSAMECHERIMLGIAIRRKYKGSSKEEKIIWNGAIDKARAGIVWDKGILTEVPVFKDISAKANKRNEPYEENRDLYFRLTRDYGAHCLEHRWKNDERKNTPDAEMEKFPDDDSVELMIPMYLGDFLARLIEELIYAKVDIRRELSSAVVRCSRCEILELCPKVEAVTIDRNYTPTWMQNRSPAEIAKLKQNRNCADIPRTSGILKSGQSNVLTIGASSTYNAAGNNRLIPRAADTKGKGIGITIPSAHQNAWTRGAAVDSGKGAGVNAHQNAWRGGAAVDSGKSAGVNAHQNAWRRGAAVDSGSSGTSGTASGASGAAETPGAVPGSATTPGAGNQQKTEKIDWDTGTIS